MKAPTHQIDLALETMTTDPLSLGFIRFLDLFSNNDAATDERFRNRSFSLLLLLYFVASCMLLMIYAKSFGLADTFAAGLTCTAGTALFFLIKNASQAGNKANIDQFLIIAQLLSVIGIAFSSASSLPMIIGLCTLIIYSYYFADPSSHLRLTAITIIGTMAIGVRIWLEQNPATTFETTLYSWNILVICSLLSTLLATYLKLIKRSVHELERQKAIFYIPSLMSYDIEWLDKIDIDQCPVHAIQIDCTTCDEHEELSRLQLIVTKNIYRTFPDSLIITDQSNYSVILLLPKLKKIEEPPLNILSQISNLNLLPVVLSHFHSGKDRMGR